MSDMTYFIDMMHANKRKKVEKGGWKVGDADEFLGLTPEESAYLGMKLALSHALKENRRKKDLSQVELAKLIQSSQSRVAKMEAGDPGVSIDLLMRALLVLGASSEEVGKVISSGKPQAA
ncbi:helix-turn-helix transcriptional regulator [Alloalcanivorax venustensis]|nr:helix-turn-helix transcriptional regulator [Alloalcanivorax venustensis]